MTIHQSIDGAAISMRRFGYGWVIAIQAGKYSSLWSSPDKQEPPESELVVLVAKHRAQISSWVN
jgi:hypothetical protein